MTDKYDDIINLPRHVSQKRLPMSIKDRAAQFSPFAALTGHDAEVKETARITEKRLELDQYMKEKLNHKLQILVDKVKEEPKINNSSLYDKMQQLEQKLDDFISFTNNNNVNANNNNNSSTALKRKEF